MSSLFPMDSLVNKRERETWLCDLGNSRAKLARLEGGELVDFVAIRWEQDALSERVRRATAGWPRPDRILVASVTSSERATALRSQLPNEAGIATEWLKSPRSACGVTNRYRRPDRLGIDRFLSMVAVRARNNGAAIVVGCGTALTLDAITSDGEHAAGLISLSPAYMLRAIREDVASERHADIEPEGEDPDEIHTLATDCWTATGVLVRWFAARQHDQIGTATVWLHGGWADSLAAWLRHDGFHAEVIEHAVLRGLAVWATQQSEPS